MRRREDEAITKHTINLYAGDYAKLMGLYPARVGASKIIRDLIRDHLKKIETKAAQRQHTGLVPDLDIELDREAP